MGKDEQGQPTPRDDFVHSDEPDWLATVWTVAVDCARRAGLAEFADDLVQLLSLAVVERGAVPFDLAWLRTRAEELIEEESSARRAKAAMEQRASEVGLDIRGLEERMGACRLGVPRLIPRLRSLADAHPQASRAKAMLWRAALSLARERAVLTGDQFRLYYLAWLEQISIEQIAALDLRSSGRQAIQKRLRRISASIERALVRRLRLHVAAYEWRWLQAALAGIDTTPDPSAWLLVVKGLDRIAVHAPGTSTSR